MMLHLREDVDRKALGEAANLYWKAAKWCDPAALAAFYPDPPEQLAVAKVCASPTLRVTDVKLLQVVVGEELVAPKARHRADMHELWRKGTALVQVEAYGLSSNKLEVTTVEQQWSMDPRGWHVDAAASPVDADRPW